MFDTEDLGNLGLELFQFVSREFDGSGDAIKDPAEDLFAEGPDTFSFSDEFLEGDWFFIWVGAVGRGRWENGVNGVEEGSGVVKERGWVGALEASDEVIHKDLKEVFDVLEVGVEVLFWPVVGRVL